MTHIAVDRRTTEPDRGALDRSCLQTLAVANRLYHLLESGDHHQSPSTTITNADIVVKHALTVIKFDWIRVWADVYQSDHQTDRRPSKTGWHR